MRNQKELDKRFMRLALELAAKGKGKTSPNPMVGAVVVKNKKVVGKGYHKKIGLPHAEVNALREAGSKAKGATLYVTLEPCNNYGLTPPCAPAIVSSGIKRIVVATKDPNPINHNNGMRYLRRKMIKVDVGLLQDEAEQLNEAYNKFITTGLPWVTVKVAMSLDGKIATKTGNSEWISCTKSRQVVRRLRKEVGAVLVGRNTFLKDKPRLEGVKYKVVLGSPPHQTIGVKSKFLPLQACPTYQCIDGRTWLFWCGGKGRPDLKKVLKELAKLGVIHVLIEGGGETIASAIEKRLVDRLYVFVAPKIVGGRNAITPVEGEGIKRISQALPVKDMQTRRVGEDILITACLQE